ncbi:MAG: HEPN domain-containing protein [Rhizomicrobium sp.]
MNEHLDNAVRQLLAHADEELQLGDLMFKHSASQAGRFAYLAAFHAATAVIVHVEGIGPKTHKGVQAKFSQMCAAIPELGQDLGRFLSRTYEMKQVADYKYDKVVLPEDARAAMNGAALLLGKVKSYLDAR